MRIITIDPDQRTVSWKEVDKLDLALMQALVGGMIEFVYHETKWLKDDFVVNEEGMINNMTPWALGEHVYFGPAFIVHDELDDEGRSHHSAPHIGIAEIWSRIQFK